MHRHRRIAAVVIALEVLVPAMPAGADEGDAGASRTATGATVQVRFSRSGTPAAGGSGARPAPAPAPAPAARPAPRRRSQPAAPPRVGKIQGNRILPRRASSVPARRAPAPRPPARPDAGPDLATPATPGESGDDNDTLVAPEPAIGMSPSPSTGQVVHMETWLWVDPATFSPMSKRVEAGGEWAEVRAHPREVVWELGDGARVVCRDAGRAYDPSLPARAQRPSCAHTYTRSSAGRPENRVTVTATTVWDIDWTASTGAGGYLGTVERSSSVLTRVTEIEALHV